MFVKNFGENLFHKRGNFMVAALLSLNNDGQRNETAPSILLHTQRPLRGAHGLPEHYQALGGMRRAEAHSGWPAYYPLQRGGR
jgi:hypothetical protein